MQIPNHWPRFRRKRQSVAFGKVVRGVPGGYCAELQDWPAQARCSSHHWNPGAAGASEGTTPATTKASRRKGKFRRDGHVRHRQLIEWAMVLAFALGHEEGQKFPDVRGLPPTQYRHDARPLLDSTNRRPYRTTARKEVLLQGRPHQRISSDTGRGRRHCEDNYHDAVWYVWVPLNAVRP